jgi:gentisate 1,2-dioxygenase
MEGVRIQSIQTDGRRVGYAAAPTFGQRVDSSLSFLLCRLYCLPPGIATCYPRSVNRNIFYIIGVIVVIVIVLKVLHVF